jgi:hypothetical protein
MIGSMQQRPILTRAVAIPQDSRMRRLILRAAPLFATVLLCVFALFMEVHPTRSWPQYAPPDRGPVMVTFPADPHPHKRKKSDRLEPTRHEITPKFATKVNS